MKFDKALNATRVFNILSCVMAHCLLLHSEMSNNFENIVLSLLSFLSCIGVPCFLITSGILFKKKPHQEFMKGKFISICIPWIFCGTIVYLISQFSTYSFTEYLKFILGIVSYLYYIPILIFCYLLFYVLPNKKVIYVLCIVLNLCSLLATQLGLIHIHSNFLNVANWIGYFAIGRWIADSDILSKIRMHLINTFSISLVFAISSCVIACIFGIDTYFYVMILIAVPFWFFTIYALCVMLFENNRLFEELGKVTYTIYLIHMPIAALFKKIVRASLSQCYVILPIVVIGILFIVLEVYKKIISKSNNLSKLSKVLLGLR